MYALLAGCTAADITNIFFETQTSLNIKTCGNSSHRKNLDVLAETHRQINKSS